MMDSPKKLGYRMPAEYEPHHGTLMIWPTRPGSWPFQGKAAKRAFTQIIKTIAEGERIYQTPVQKECRVVLQRSSYS